MKLSIKILIFAMCIAVTVCSFGSCGMFIPSDQVIQAEYSDLGIPAKENYPEGSTALYIMDMHIRNGVLYIGDGDYGENTGPTSIMAYDIEGEEWFCSGTVRDEAVRSFVEVGSLLVAPGTDPMDSWEYGNYYILGANGWGEMRTIPGGIHNFDMVEHGGAYFAALGVSAGEYPLARSIDKGKSFYNVQMWKDGKMLDTSLSYTNRCYELYCINESVYATYISASESGSDLRYELYKYEEADDAFVFEQSLLGKMILRDEFGKEYVKEHCVFKDRIYAATGYLVTSANMLDFNTIRFPKDERVWDITVHEGTMYVLCSLEKENGDYEISVWQNKSGEMMDIKKMLVFDYEIPAVSFTYDGDSFYFGMSNDSDEHSKNGTVLAVKYDK